MKTTFKPFLALLAIIFVMSSLSSCYKKKDTIATVTVLNETTQAPVANAEVRLYWDLQNRENLEQIGKTDGAGKVSFNYNEFYKSGQAGFAVLDVYVNGVVVGIIKIEEETTTEVTVEI
jgi:hypothetical protein